MSHDRGAHERAEQKRRTSDDGDASIRAGSRPTTGPARWVTVVLVIIGILAALAFFVLHLSGGLGPGLHGGR